MTGSRPDKSLRQTEAAPHLLQKCVRSLSCLAVDLPDEQIEVLFAEQWTPLDALTLRHLRRLHPAIGTTLPDQADVPVFTHSIWKLNAAVRKVVGLPVKKLRMTAIANIIRSGVTDRGAISRITGAMLNTVAYIERAFAWDLQMTVDPEIVKSRNEVIRGERTE